GRLVHRPTSYWRQAVRTRRSCARHLAVYFLHRACKFFQNNELWQTNLPPRSPFVVSLFLLTPRACSLERGGEMRKDALAHRITFAIGLIGAGCWLTATPASLGEG